MLNGFQTALSTLTILPVAGSGAPRFGTALFFFPLVGALIGGLVGLTVYALGGLLHWPLGAGVAGIVVSVWLTRGLHLDGLGDVADAYFGGVTLERRLAIMKDPHIGAFGAAAICLALAVKAVALARLASGGLWFWIPAPFLCARAVLVLLAATLPYARKEGGKAREFIAQAGMRHAVAAVIMALVLPVLLAGISALVVAAPAFGLAWLLRFWMRREFGGVTGDLLGCANEVVECLLLFGLAAFAPCLPWP
jgi:adenosylcobinamide-GDP ribazoletransferase